MNSLVKLDRCIRYRPGHFDLLRSAIIINASKFFMLKSLSDLHF